MKIRINTNYIILSLLFLMSLEQSYTQINIKDDKLQQNKITSVAGKLEQQLAENKISINEWVKYIVYSNFEPSKLPLEYKNLERNGLGTWILKEIFNNWLKLSISTKLELQKYGFNNNGALAPPSGLDSTRETTHFKFHYSVASGDSNAITSTDTDSNSTPDYLDSMMTVFEFVWFTEIDSFGYSAPPGDGTRGGDSKYDVYISKLDPDLFGFESPDSLIKDNPNSTVTEINAATSHLSMRNEYSLFPEHTQLENIQVTAAHEFFHSVQDGYDVFAKRWLQEAASTWMEDEVYDNVNDNYQYLQNWFNAPWYPLDATNAERNNHWYGSFIFFKYISEHIGGINTVKEIWEKTLNYRNDSTDYSFNAIDDALTTHVTNFKNVFRDFLIANYIKTILPYNYSEAANYPAINFEKTMYGNMQYQTFLFRHGASYIHISPNLLTNGTDQISFTFTSLDSTADFGIQLITKKGNAVTKNIFSSNFTLNNTKTFDEITIIIMDFSTAQNVDGRSLKYKLSIQSNSNLYQLTYNDTDDLDPQVTDSLISWYRDNELESNPNGEGWVDRNGNRQKLSLSKEARTIAPRLDDTNYVYISSLIDANNQEYPAILYFDNTSSIATFLTDTTYTLFEGFGGGDTKLFFNDKKIMFKANLKDKGRAIFISNAGGVPAPINPYRIDVLYTIEQFTKGEALWWTITPLGQPDTLHYFNGSVSTTFTDQIIKDSFYKPPYLDNGQIVYAKPDASGKHQIYLNTGPSTIKLTSDTTKENYAPKISGNFVAWKWRDLSDPVNWWRDYMAFADLSQGTIKILRDSITKWPDATGGDFIIDSSSVVWYGIDQAEPGIFYSDDTTITKIMADTAWRGMRFDFKDDRVAISGWDGNDYEIFLYTKQGLVTSVDDNNNQVPNNFSLSQNYPNPFNPMTTIEFDVPRQSQVKLEIFNILGQKVTELVNREYRAGNYKVNFDASRFASGVYLYRIIAGKFIQTKKMILLK